MKPGTRIPDVVPSNTVRFCIAYGNKASGFYSNHHLDGDKWLNNSAYKNAANYNMVNRKSAFEIVNVPGYNHVLINNLSFSPRRNDGDIININLSRCKTTNNTFLPSNMNVSRSDFVSLNVSQLIRPRKVDGSLPDIDFMRLKKNSKLFNAGIGYSAVDKNK